MTKRKRSKKSGGGEGGGPSKKQKLMPGLAPAGHGRYQRPALELERRSTQVWKPVPNTDLQNEDVIEFSLTVKADEMIRFPENAFCLNFLATVPNPDYQEPPKAPANDVRTEVQKRKRNFLDPKNLAPAAFIENSLGGSAWFDKMDVYINGFLLDHDHLGNFQHIWQTMNRIYTDAETQRDR